MKYKAEYCDSEKNGEFKTFKYRGYFYDVNYNIFLCSTPPYIQHKQEQERIDEMIEQNEKNRTTEDWKDGFEVFWDFVEGRIE